MLGNIGYSSMQCTFVEIEVGQITLQCPYGYIGEVVGAGVNPYKESGAVDYCLNSASESVSQCQPPDISAETFAGATGKESKTYDNLSLVNIYPDPTAVDDVCYDPANMLFVQYQCVMTDEMISEKYSQLTLIVACGLFICMLFSLLIFHLRQTGKIKNLKWDVATITAGDYTVEHIISAADYKNWHAHEFMQSSMDMSPALSFKKYLMEHLSETLQSEIAAFVHAGNHIKDCEMRCPIVDIQFAFNNSKVVSELQKRGAIIANQKWDNLPKAEKDLENLFDNEFDKQTTPNSCFITFEFESTKRLALCNEIHKEQDKHFLKEGSSQLLKFSEAPEPTNIIWQNRHFTSTDYLKRGMKAYCIIFILIIGSFISILLVANYQQ